LAALLERVVQAAPDIPWIRVMYAYPGYVTPRLIETMATHSQILPYLDIPLQHGHRETLKRMRRPANIEWVYSTLEQLRSAMPNLCVRTTFIVGYPGETDEEFDGLLRFVEDLKFDRVGAFTYSYELGTPSAELPNMVADEVKQARYEQLMELQQGISLSRSQALVGQTLDVLVEGHGMGEDEDGEATGDVLSVARSYRDAPEIDGYVIVEGELPVGKIVPVQITGATAYDLFGAVMTQRPIVIQPGQVISEGMIDLSRDRD
jgi:ribosomal protein S12 methylthiotransferase